MSEPPARLADTLSRFADRLFHTGGEDPGDDAIAVPTERMEVYRGLLFGNYKSMLRFAYTATFRIVVHEAKRAIVVANVDLDTAVVRGAREMFERVDAVFDEQHTAASLSGEARTGHSPRARARPRW